MQTLEQALAAAYQNNPELRAERARLRATDERVPQALSGWRPSLDASASGGSSRQSFSGNGVPAQDGTLTPANVSLNVTQPVFDGFRTQAGVRSAEAAVKAGRAGLQTAEQKLLLDAARAYLGVVQAQALLDLDHDNEAVLQKELDETEDRLKIGELKKTDVAQAQSRLKTVTVSRLQAAGDLANARMTFARIVGQMPGTLARPDLKTELPQTQEEAAALALQNNPAVIAADYSERAARADISAAKGSLLPEFDITGSAAHAQEQNLVSPSRQDTATVLARLTVPLYRSGEDYAKTRAVQQTALQKRLELDDTRNKAREEASNAWQSLVTARDSKAGLQEAASATADALEGVKVEHKFGTRSTLDVLNAEQELLNARTSLVKADYAEMLAMLQLKAAIGELTAGTMHLPAAIYDPAKNYNAVRNKWAGFSDIKE